MINLLPPDLKSAYRYGRLNVTLRRWVVMCLVAFVGLGLLSTYGLFSLRQSTVRYNNQIADSQATLKKENFTGVQNQVKDITDSFKLVLQVLSQEVLFSQLLTHIGATIPTNANLTGLNISQTQGAIDVSAITPDYNTATQVQVNLANPANQIFSKADIVSITCNGASAADPRFPCTVNIKALFARNNPFLFINSKVAKP